MAQSRILQSPYESVNAEHKSAYATVEKAFEKYPDNLALVDVETDQRLTYTELRALVERVAYNLFGFGVRKNDVFAISSITSIKYVVVLLACMRLGCIPCLISNQATKDELRNYLTVASAKYLFVDIARANTGMDAGNGTTIEETFTSDDHDQCISWRKLEDDDVSSGKDMPTLSDENIWKQTGMYLFSSGTTGCPKAVELTQCTIVEAAGMISGYLGFSSGPTIMYQPIAHVYGVAMVLSSLYHGFLSILMPKFNLDKYIHLISEWKVTHLQLVPPILVMLVKSPLVTKERLERVRSILVGASPTTPELESLARQKLHEDVCFRNAYAMTETTFITVAPGPEHNIPGSVPAGSTGLVAPNCHIKVCNLSTGEPVGPGERGEVLVDSPYHMKGYLKNAEQTAEAIDDDGWLHTGDVATYDENGYVFIVDRIKELIKCKGLQVITNEKRASFRAQIVVYGDVSPSELEGILLKHPLVADVAVTSIPSEMEGELPQAWVVKKEESLTEDAVKLIVAEKTAPYKHLRGGVRFVDTIPKSPSGKIIRRVIKEQAWADATNK